MIKSLQTLNHGYAEFQDEKSPGSLLHEELSGKAMWRAGKESVARMARLGSHGPQSAPLIKRAEAGAYFGGAIGAYALLPVDLIFGTGVNRGGGFDLVDPVALKQHLLHSFAHPSEAGLAGIALGLTVATVFVVSGSLGAVAGALIGGLIYIALRHKDAAFNNHMVGAVSRGIDVGIIGLGSGVVMVSGLVPATMALGGMRFVTALLKGASVGLCGTVGALVGLSSSLVRPIASF